MGSLHAEAIAKAKQPQLLFRLFGLLLRGLLPSALLLRGLLGRLLLSGSLLLGHSHSSLKKFW